MMFPRAIPEPRGCGEREPGGVYVESGLSPDGLPLETFLLDPPLPVPEGIDLINKSLLWPRALPTGEAICEPETGEPISDVLIHVGASHYPYAPDYLEEVRRLGASRKLSPLLDLSLLSRRSKMLLAHPKARATNWQQMQPPAVCPKQRVGHAGVPAGEENAPVGPCIFKLWDLIPSHMAQLRLPDDGQRPAYLRQIGSTIYTYHPTDEAVEHWQEGFVLALPITGIALIRYADGTVRQSAKERILAGLEKHGQSALPFYETDK